MNSSEFWYFSSFVPPLICVHIQVLLLFFFSSPPSLLVAAPADGCPLRFILHLLDDGAELHAGVPQVVIHQSAIENLPVLGLHQPGRLLQLHKVILLQEEKQVALICSMIRVILIYVLNV